MIKNSSSTGTERHGFTLTEVMITLSLFMVLASVGMGAYFKYYQFSLVNNDLVKITKILHDTRFKAMKNPYNSDYGLHIDPDTKELTTFRATYTPSNPENISLKLEQMDIVEVNLMPNPGITDDIVFENITGKTPNSGSFKVQKDEFSHTLYINPQGAFE